MQSSDNLPTLPRKLHKKEATYTPAILRWFRVNHEGPCAIEIKVAKGNTVAPSALAGHQRSALRAAAGGGIVHKLSDEARRRQPFDAFMLKGVPAYVVCVFPQHRYARVIPIERFDGATDWSPADFIIPL